MDWQSLIDNLGKAINTAAGVAGNVASTIQGIKEGSYQNQQQIEQQQQQQQQKSNNILLYGVLAIVGLFVLFKVKD